MKEQLEFTHIDRKYIEHVDDDHTMLLVSFFVTNELALKRLISQWGQRDVAHQQYLGRNQNKKDYVSMKEFGGSICVFDGDDITRGIVAEFKSETATGMHFDSELSGLFVGNGNHINEISNGNVVDVINNNLFNDIHSIAGTENAHLLVVSTALDAILEIDKRGEHAARWSWLGTEHGYPLTPAGQSKVVDIHYNYQEARIPTPEHTTHVNSAITLGEGKILATLFHQGTLVCIDQTSGNTEVLVSNMKSPHSIRRTDNGYTIADTRNNRVLFFDKDFRLVHSIGGDFNWVQDALVMKDGTVLVADSNNYKIHRVDGNGVIRQQYDFSGNLKKIYSFLLLDAQAVRRLLFNK